MQQTCANAKNLKDVNSWNSTSITQFELAKVIYTSGFLQTCNLTATAKLVLMALIQHYNANNADMFPSQKFLAQQLGISEKSVERAIANLKEENYIYYVTQRVNRYRFTAHFFESVKMSVLLRQNVGCGVRQNVGETNNIEKRKEKEVFLFSEGGEESSFGSSNLKKGTDVPNTSILKVDFKKNKRYKKQDNGNFFSAAQFLKSFSKTPADEVYDAFAQLKEKEAQKRRKKEYAQKMADALTPAAQRQGAKTQNLPAFDGLLTETWAGPEKNEESEKSPFDWSKDEALLWVRSLSPALRVRGLAKSLCEKHNFSKEDIFAAGENQPQAPSEVFEDSEKSAERV